MIQPVDIQPCALTIAGSDSGGGAGIQADLKAFHSAGVHGTSAITALTAQNLTGVHAVQVVPAEFMRAQLDAVLNEFDVRAIKIGMLANAEIAEVVAQHLSASRYAGIPVVLDPVMIATSGAKLLTDDAVRVIRDQLMPRACLITPNVPEAELLCGNAMPSAEDLLRGGEQLLSQGAQAVLLKGAHLENTGTQITDTLLTTQSRKTFTHQRLPFEAHGTGCTLSSAIAAQLALGKPLEDAVGIGIEFVADALRHSYRLSDSAVRVLRA